MVRRACAWIVMGAVVVALALPVLAQTSQPASPKAANPCAAKAMNPCAAKAMNPCAAKAVNPCAAKMAKTKSATGTVKMASADSLVLLVGKAKKEMMFVIDKDTKVTKGDKAVEAAGLGDKTSVTVTYTEAEGKMVAKMVKVKAATTAAKPKTY